MNIGFYVHYEDQGYMSYHAPGFPPNTGFSDEESKLVPLLREYGLKMQNLPKTMPFPTPDTPTTAVGMCINPKSLRWRGSSWAACYRLQRQAVGTSEWIEISDSIMDNVESGCSIFQDKSAQCGQCYVYRVQALGVNGQSNGQWLTLGPCGI